MEATTLHIFKTVFFTSYFPRRDLRLITLYMRRLRHRLNMEVDLQSLFGLHVTLCAQLYSLAETPHPPSLGHVYEGAIGQQR